MCGLCLLFLCARGAQEAEAQSATSTDAGAGDETGRPVAPDALDGGTAQPEPAQSAVADASPAPEAAADGSVALPAQATGAPAAELQQPAAAAIPEDIATPETVATDFADSATDVGAPQLEELVVTARRREEGLQSAPVAVTAFSEQDLARRNVDSADDLSQFTPNLQLEGAAALSGSSSNATVFIRGIGQNDFAIFSDPGVGTYVDDVYLGRSIGALLDVVDVRRLEVLRGPQGTLFGRNTIGGAVLVTSQQPRFEPEGSVELTTGRYFRSDFRTTLNAPLVDDRLALRISAARLGRDGYARRLVDNGPLGDINRVVGRAQLLWKPSDKLNVLLSTDGTRAREHSAASTLVAVNDGGFPFQNIFNTLVAPETGITKPGSTVSSDFITGNPFTTYASGPNRSDLDNWGVSLTPTWQLHPDIALKSITAYRRLRANFARDGDNTPFAFRETEQDNRQWQVSQELQLSGDSWDDKLSWIVGAYYFQEYARENATARLAEGTFDALEALPGPRAFPPGGPPAEACMSMDAPMGCFGGMGNPANVSADLVIDLKNKVINRSVAGYAHLSYAVLEPLLLTAGLRLTHERKEFALTHRRVASGAYIVPPNTELSGDWTSLDPKAGVEFHAAENALTYFTFSRGFKSGGFNGRPIVSVAEVTKYDPEKLYSYEMGVKTDWAKRALVANLAVFYYDYRNIQLTVLQTPANFVANAARAALFGGELELRARPLRPLVLNASVGYLHASYKEVGAGLGPGQNLPITTGSKLPKAPALNVSGGAEYTQELGGRAGALRLRADVAYRSKVYHDVANTEVLAQPGFALINARCSWVSDSENWEAAVFLTNLTDARYRISGNASGAAFGVAESAYGRPREWGATLLHRF